MSNKNSVFGSNLKTVLKYKNISSKTFAQAIGVSPSTVSMWLTQNTLPRMELVPKISDFLGLEEEIILLMYSCKVNFKSCEQDSTPCEQDGTFWKLSNSLGPMFEFHKSKKQPQNIYNNSLKKLQNNADVLVNLFASLNNEGQDFAIELLRLLNLSKKYTHPNQK